MLVLADILEIGVLCLVPAYNTYKQLKATAKNQGNLEKNQQIFQYWIAYITFRGIDVAGRSLMPNYNVVKIPVVLWLGFSGGMDFCYQWMARTILINVEPTIDRWFNRNSILHGPGNLLGSDPSLNIPRSPFNVGPNNPRN
ncbi:TB2/DP1/HVA22-related protein [Cinara cedri]|uniref:TB2/DP1/HVA22-related protein n=1 Tax=Cinara cedri TaxID=506608 RepID=A0A5E4M5Y8_9HEMI|nr:TB2/DP1/HVA22-related protein [Cinara cedri]